MLTNKGICIYIFLVPVLYSLYPDLIKVVDTMKYNYTNKFKSISNNEADNTHIILRITKIE